MFLVYFHNHSIEKEYSGILVDEINISSIQNVVNQWDCFDDHELRLYGIVGYEDFNFYNRTNQKFLEDIAFYLVDEFNYQSYNNAGKKIYFNQLLEFQDDTFTEYYIGILEIDHIKEKK